MQASACHSFRVRGWLLLNRALVTLCQEPSTVSLGSATGLHSCLPWTQGCPTLKLTAGDWLGSLPMILLLSFGPGKTSLWSCPWPHLKVGHRAPSYLSFSKDFLDSCCTQEKAKHLEPLRISILTAAGWLSTFCWVLPQQDIFPLSHIKTCTGPGSGSLSYTAGFEPGFLWTSWSCLHHWLGFMST